MELAGNNLDRPALFKLYLASIFFLTLLRHLRYDYIFTFYTAVPLHILYTSP